MRARLATALFTIVLACSALPAAAAPILSVSPVSPIVNVGDTFTVNIDLSNVTDLYGFQFDLGFDPTRLQVVPQNSQAVTEGSFLKQGGATDFLSGVDNGLGTIEFTLAFLLGAVPGVSGSGNIASITFMALATGVSPFTLSNYLLLDSAGGLIDPTIQNGSVEITTSAAVPEPGTLLLLASGLAVAARRRLKRQRSV